MKNLKENWNFDKENIKQISQIVSARWLFSRKMHNWNLKGKGGIHLTSAKDGIVCFLTSSLSAHTFPMGRTGVDVLWAKLFLVVLYDI